jgi:hypothetical protein
VALLSGFIWMAVVNARAHAMIETMEETGMGPEAMVEFARERIEVLEAKPARTVEEQDELDQLYQMLEFWRDVERQRAEGVSPLLLALCFAAGGFMTFFSSWLSAHALLRWCRRNGVLFGQSGESATAAEDLPEVFS